MWENRRFAVVVDDDDDPIAFVFFFFDLRGAWTDDNGIQLEQNIVPNRLSLSVARFIPEGVECITAKKYTFGDSTEQLSALRIIPTFLGAVSGIQLEDFVL